MLVRRRRGSALSTILVAGLALGGLTAQEQGGSASGGSACNLEPWVSDVAAPGEEGYHVLCATRPTIEVYRQGVRSAGEPVLYRAGRASLRSGLANLLKINEYIKYPAGQTHEALEWKKQPWALFTADGDELPEDEEADAIAGLLGDGGDGGVVVLLFEGGAWRWPTISVGYRREVSPGLWLRTVSRQPALFEVKIDDLEQRAGSDSHLSIQLLSNVVNIAEKRLPPSSMEGRVDKTVRTSDQTFLPYDVDPQLQQLRAGTIKLLHTSEDHLEPLQVVRYGVNQHYDAHRDYWDPREFPNVRQFTNPEGFWRQRFATLLWYLSPPIKGGETWFPRAHGGPIPWNEWMACDSRGAMVSPSNATAVLFYSLRADGEIDEFSWHCGCKVQEGVKWVANSWAHISPNKKRRKRTDL